MSVNSMLNTLVWDLCLENPEHLRGIAESIEGFVDDSTAISDATEIMNMSDEELNLAVQQIIGGS